MATQRNDRAWPFHSTDRRFISLEMSLQEVNRRLLAANPGILLHPRTPGKSVARMMALAATPQNPKR